MQTADATRPERGPMARQYKKVYGPWRTTPLHVVILSQTLVEKWTHYDPFIKKNRPCVSDGTCLYCTNHQARRYKAFVAAIRCDTSEVCVAELTEHAVNCLVDLKVDFKAMRGLRITLKRHRQNVNGPVHVTDLRKVPNPGSLPPAFDVEPHLLRLWGWQDRNIDALGEKAEAERAEAGLAAGELPNEPEVPY